MWELGGHIFSSRFLLGTAQYPSLTILEAAIRASKTQIITVSLKRQMGLEKKSCHFWEFIKALPCHILPNTAGCRTAEEAVTLAQIAREIFQTHWIKLEVIGDDDTLAPNPFELVKAAKRLVEKGFEVFPYCTEDLILCRHLVDSGCRILMPWAAPIGSGRGLMNAYALEMIRARFSNISLIIDAGIGKPSDASIAMELGFDGVLLNSAVSLAWDPVSMASAFRHAIIGGRKAYKAGLMPMSHSARSSTFLTDTLFWHQEEL